MILLTAEGKKNTRSSQKACVESLIPPSLSLTGWFSTRCIDQIIRATEMTRQTTHHALEQETPAPLPLVAPRLLSFTDVLSYWRGADGQRLISTRRLQTALVCDGRVYHEPSTDLLWQSVNVAHVATYRKHHPLFISAKSALISRLHISYLVSIVMKSSVQQTRCSHQLLCLRMAGLRGKRNKGWLFFLPFITNWEENKFRTVCLEEELNEMSCLEDCDVVVKSSHCCWSCYQPPCELFFC